MQSRWDWGIGYSVGVGYPVTLKDTISLESAAKGGSPTGAQE